MLGNAIFNVFQRVFGGLRTIKIKTILTIFYVYYNRSFPQNLNHWLLEKSEMINLQMLIQKNTFNVLSSCFPLKKKRAQQCLPRFLWHTCHFGTCESLGSSSVKMSQAFQDPSIRFPGVGGTPIYGLYRYVPRNRVWFLRFLVLK